MVNIQIVVLIKKKIIKKSIIAMDLAYLELAYSNISKSFATNKHVNLKDGKKYIDTKWYVRRQSEKTVEG